MQEFITGAEIAKETMHINFIVPSVILHGGDRRQNGPEGRRRLPAAFHRITGVSGRPFAVSSQVNNIAMTNYYVSNFL
jgi:hypothetical protein